MCACVARDFRKGRIDRTKRALDIFAGRLRGLCTPEIQRQSSTFMVGVSLLAMPY